MWFEFFQVAFLFSAPVDCYLEKLLRSRASQDQYDKEQAAIKTWEAGMKKFHEILQHEIYLLEERETLRQDPSVTRLKSMLSSNRSSGVSGKTDKSLPN
ncbi:hypothetical protein MW887_001143 [Aspergillus wentii]|nr:hypothetical protein MW887_001143 [Aspergillus wentii]